MAARPTFGRWVITRNSKAIIKGLIKIGPDANSSNGYQKSDVLLLDKTSRAISLPDLKIHNDDVKCSHGSTITRIDAEKIFYLKSRGISSSEAQALIIEGLYDEILLDVNDEELRLKLREEILEQ